MTETDKTKTAPSGQTPTGQPPTGQSPTGKGANGKGLGGWGRGMRLLLIGSLGLNLVIVGLVAGAVIDHVRRDRPPIVRDLGFGPYSRALSHQDRIALMRGFAQETGGFRAMRREARAEFGRLLELLRAEPFDAAALKALMQKQETRAVERLALGQKLLIERIEAMSPADRRAFADRLQVALAHDGHHRPSPPQGN
ncbi:periplasmic heavy metal sensor [Acidimangrovimonas pyrenivorans]|uniref:Periplasmic heavy metal sensor n=1 Tax=Acidimangrovimonas pyrenivorans TaxID=2030798 RepID=A0ABV7ALH9_9RHOB